jgi:hypothetical protein
MNAWNGLRGAYRASFKHFALEWTNSCHYFPKSGPNLEFARWFDESSKKRQYMENVQAYAIYLSGELGPYQSSGQRAREMRSSPKFGNVWESEIYATFVVEVRIYVIS